MFSFTSYVCVEYLPLGSAGSLDHAIWMLLVPVTSRTILNEKISLVQWIAIILAISGSALIFMGLVITTDFDAEMKQPDILTEDTTAIYENISDNNSKIDLDKKKYNLHTEQYRTTNIPDFVFGLSLAIATGVSGNLCIAFSKILQEYLQSPLILAVWYNISGIILCGICMSIFEVNDLALPSDVKSWLFFSTHVSSNVGICITFYSATYFASAVVCNITFNLEIPLRIICQYLIFSSLQPIDGSLYDLIGGIIITLAVILPSAKDFITFLKERTFHTIKSEEYRLIGKSVKSDST